MGARIPGGNAYEKYENGVYDQGPKIPRAQVSQNTECPVPLKELIDKLDPPPHTSQVQAQVAQKFEKKLPQNWFCDPAARIKPFENADITPTSNMIVYPWLKSGDIVLITGYGRNCNFLKILDKSIFKKDTFFGKPLDNVQCNFVTSLFTWDSPFVDSRLAIVHDIPLDMGNRHDIEEFKKYVNLKRANNTALICVFKYEHSNLKNMDIWDVIIEIGRERQCQKGSPHKVRTVRFLKSHLPYRLHKICYKMISHIPKNHSGYEDSEDLYFVNNVTGYESLKDSIAQLFDLGHSASEIKKILEIQDKVVLSLPMLNKLLRIWGLRKYRLETKPRKKKTPRKPSAQSASPDVQI